jgi:PhnB protein
MAKKRKVQPIPKGYPPLSPYLCVDGAGRAIEFYKKAFGAKERMRMPGPEGRIGHAELEIGESLIMIGDPRADRGAPPSPREKAGPVSFMLYVKDVDAVYERALRLGATAVTPPENRFYGDRNGMVRDPFGIQWTLGTHIEDVSPKDVARRAREAAAQAQGTSTPG